MAEITKLTDMKFREKEPTEPERLYEIRREGWKAYQNMPLPDQVAHLWRYTKPEHFLVEDPLALMKSHKPLSRAEEETVEAELEDYSGIGTVQAEGLIESVLAEEFLEKGVFLGSLYEASKEYGDLLEKHLGKIVGVDFGKFEAMNAALWGGGLFLYVPDNVTLDKPIFIRRDITGGSAFTRILAVFGKNTEGTLVDSFGTTRKTEGGLVNGIAEVYADDYARVRYVNLQNLPRSYNTYITQRAKIEKESKIYTIFGGLGSANSKVDVGTILNGIGSESKMYGAVFADESQHFDYHTVHHHSGAESYSDIDFKVILKDKATSAYTGLIKIDRDTKNCQAYQINRNLLLNKGPKAESIPELEIETDEVQCSHGATMGPIDPEMLFYLKSRGFNHYDAVRKIIEGFIEPTAAQLPDDLGDWLRNLVITKLEG